MRGSQRNGICHDLRPPPTSALSYEELYRNVFGLIRKKRGAFVYDHLKVRAGENGKGCGGNGCRGGGGGINTTTTVCAAFLNQTKFRVVACPPPLFL